MIAPAALFLLILLLYQNTSLFKNGAKNQKGLVYDPNETVKDLVGKDTDGDGVPDWEEGLWGTDPLKKETAPGIPDSVAIEKLKVAQGKTEQGLPLLKNGNLTQTDKFSQELFATIASLSQNGELDQATIEKISNSLANHIQNSPPRKVYVLADVKVIKDNSVQAVKTYNDTLNDIIDKKYPLSQSVTAVLQKFIVDENNVDVSVLSQLDPIIAQKNKIINAMVKMDVPQSLSLLHLDLLNVLQRLVENISDVRLYDTDSIVALGAISQYEQNTDSLQSAIDKLKNAIDQKLNS